MTKEEQKALDEARKKKEIRRERKENLRTGKFTSFDAVTAADKGAKDPIHPSHYKEHPSGIECIEITRWANFNIGNVIKYLWRSGRKDPSKEIEDLKKAAWYLNDEIQRLEKISQQSS